MSDAENKSVESRAVDTRGEIGLERERLEIEKKRLQLEIDFRETSKKLDAERFILEKSKERTAKLQIGLPVLVSVLALLFSAFGEYRRSSEARELQKMQYELQHNQAVSSYNDGRIELFRRLTEQSANAEEIKKIYSEIFARDSLSLEREQREVDARPQ